MNQVFKNRDVIVSEISSRWVLLYPDGSERVININEDREEPILEDFNESLANLIRSFKNKSKKPGSEAKSIKEMKRLGWAEYESASDKGHLRYYPKGALVYSLLEDWHENFIIDKFQAEEIKTPFFFNWAEEDIRSQVETFYDRLYYVKGYGDEKNFVLRFGGDFGVFSMMKSMQLVYKHLPYRVYEFANSFRYNKSGEVRGLQRGRSFSFFDLHSFCLDEEQGWLEFSRMYKLHVDMAKEIGIDFAVEVTVSEEFYNNHKDLILSLAQYIDHPILIEVLSKQKHYWVIKYVFHTVDTYKFFNAQLDFENAKRYGVQYVSSEGRKEYCSIVHGASSSIERWMFLALEDALKHPQPVLPLWLSTTQLRIIILNNRFIQESLTLANQLKSFIRVDIDDRDKSLNWKIRSARSEWVPYYIIFGQSEAESGEIFVQSITNSNIKMPLPGFVEYFKREMVNKPFRKLGLLCLSKRP